MQPQGTSTPLFFVHAVDGQVMSYAELSRELGLEQPFYGLQSPSAEFFPDSNAGITQMATLYIREMRTVQPHGPYPGRLVYGRTSRMGNGATTCKAR